MEIQETKTLLPSLYRREELPPLWPQAHRASGPEGKEGAGEIFRTMCLLNCGLLSNTEGISIL